MIIEQGHYMAFMTDEFNCLRSLFIIDSQEKYCIYLSQQYLSFVLYFNCRAFAPRKNF